MIDNLLDVFGSNNSQPVNQTPSHTLGMLDDILGNMGTAPTTTYNPAGQSLAVSLYNAYEDNNISIGFSIKRDQSDSTTYLIRACYQNKTSQVLSQLNMQVAVQKYMKLQMFPASSTGLQPHSTNEVIQDMKIQNTMDGQKPLALKLRVLYTMAGQQIAETKVINALPASS